MAIILKPSRYFDEKPYLPFSLSLHAIRSAYIIDLAPSDRRDAHLTTPCDDIHASDAEQKRGFPPSLPCIAYA